MYGTKPTMMPQCFLEVCFYCARKAAAAVGACIASAGAERLPFIMFGALSSAPRSLLHRRVHTTTAAMGKPLNTLLANMPTTIFEVMSKLAAQHNSVNLGQGTTVRTDIRCARIPYRCARSVASGFPDDALEGPASMKDVLSRYVHEQSNQYPSLMGLPVLRQALARHNKARCTYPLEWCRCL